MIYVVNLLKNKKIKSETIAEANSVLSMAFIKLDKKKEALKTLKIASKNTKDKKDKARLLYIEGQMYEREKNIDSAKSAFNQIVGFKRKIDRNIFINAKVRTLLYSDSLDSKKEFLKLIKN